MNKTDDSLADFFLGKRLYGDDFAPDEIRAWFSEEAEGYANLGAKDADSYCYEYHALNWAHAFRHIEHNKFEKALGIGSAYGDEFKPIAHQVEHITVLDPSSAFDRVRDIDGTPCNYVRPNELGYMSFSDEEFDLISCLGVLHHIPNVSTVLSECFRCLRPGGVMVVREPISSMGDWRKARPGLTRRERGIPVALFDDIVDSCGFEVQRKKLCTFPLFTKLARIPGFRSPYNSRVVVALDELVCNVIPWRLVYFRSTVVERLAPGAVHYILRK